MKNRKGTVKWAERGLMLIFKLRSLNWLQMADMLLSFLFICFVVPGIESRASCLPAELCPSILFCL
jgi:hypothetical protein